MRMLEGISPPSYAELLDNLLLSLPQDRKSAESALQMLLAPRTIGGNQYLEKEMKLVGTSVVNRSICHLFAGEA